MVRRVVPAAVLIAALVGCGKQVAVPGLGGGSDSGSGGNPDATYALKVREKQAGDKFQVTETQSAATRTDSEAGNKKGSVESSESAKYEFTEDILEVKDGRPVRVKRAYTVAEVKGKPASFAGKTVDILVQKSGQVSARVEKGGAVGKDEAKYFTAEFGGRDRLGDLLPTRAVKVNETFTLEPAQLEKLPGMAGQGAASGDGKLTRVYTKDGRQYGVVELGVNVNLPSDPQTGAQPGSATTVVVYDGCVDGSVTDAEVKATTTVSLAARNPQTGATRKQLTETVRTMTVRPVAK